MGERRSWLVRGGRRSLVGVVHLGPTPGSPRFAGDFDRVLDAARADAAALRDGGADALVVENFGDAPFFAGEVPPETVAGLARALAVVGAEVGGLPVGVNVLRNDARAGLGLCAAAGASFLRVNVHTGAMVTDQGLLQGDAASTLRERERLCPDALLLADVHVKHATPLGDEDLAQAAEETARRGLADALIVTGARTSHAPGRRDLARVRDRVPDVPLLVGSGLDLENALELLESCDGAIVGTALKRDGRLSEPVDVERVRGMRARLDAAGD